VQYPTLTFTLGRPQAGAPPPASPPTAARGTHPLQQCFRDNAWLLGRPERAAIERERLQLLQSIHDGPSCARLAKLVRRGWRCLEIGPGGGSICAWLAQQVGDPALVSAADVSTVQLGQLAQLGCRVMQHDVMRDPPEALGGNAYDLIFARFVFSNLPNGRDAVIAQLVACLKPGGWLVIEDQDPNSVWAADPSHPLSAEFDAITQQSAGSPWAQPFGRYLSALFRRCGLMHIDHSIEASIAAGGDTAHARLRLLTVEGYAAEFAALDFDATEREGLRRAFAVWRAAFTDPQFLFVTKTVHWVAGQRVAEAPP
jgi:SAM-dependent methyltransferase